MTRGDIEGTFRARGVAYRQMNTATDLVLIETLGSDWVCVNKGEHLAFQFSPTLNGRLGEPQPEDTLIKIDLRFEGSCL